MKFWRRIAAQTAIFAVWLAVLSVAGVHAIQVAGPSPVGLNIPPAAHAAKDPLPKAKTNLVAGAGIYRENCAGCHGPEGTPLRRFNNLAQQPATLNTQTLKAFSDGDLNWILEHGAPGGMPSFAEDMNAQQRWQCIEFVRHLGKDAAKYAAAYDADHPAKGKP